MKSAPAPIRTMAEVLADIDVEDDAEPITLSGLPPLSGADEIKRSVPTLPPADLTGLAKLWLLFGEGATGKTVLARWLTEKLMANGRGKDTMVAALAPGNRNLADFVPGIQQPSSNDPKEVAAWTMKRLRALEKQRWGGVWDFGGGDISHRLMIQAQPTMAADAEQHGLAMVAAYLFSPRLDDLAFLKTYQEAGFQPRATALILNLGRAESPAAFRSLQRQPEYRAALDRGAVELWMPAMPQHVALAIEKARVQFRHARDGEAPDGKKPASISMLERVVVRDWLMRMDDEFMPIAGWLPWS